MALRRKGNRGPKVDFGEKGWRFVRLWETLMTIVEAEKPLSVPEINERVAVGTYLREYAGKFNTTRDDLSVLTRCHMPIMLVDEEGEEIEADPDYDGDMRGRLKNTRWALKPGHDVGVIKGAHHRAPTSAELTSLALLRAVLTEYVPEGFPIFAHVETLLGSLQQWYGTRISGGDRKEMIDRFLQTGKRYVKKGPETTIMTKIAEALHRKANLEGLYQYSESKSGMVSLHPLAAWFKDGKGHLFAARTKDGELRNFRFDRFATAKVVSDGRTPIWDQKEVDRLLAGSFGGYVTEPEKVVLRISPKIAYLFDDYQFHASQKIRRMRDGTVKATLECAVGLSLEEWILGLGENAEVMQPDHLRARIAGRHRAACAMYD